LTQPNGWRATWKQSQLKMTKLRKKRRHWKTKWIIERRPSFNSCFPKLIKIESRIRWRFNNLTIRLKKYMVISSSLNHQIKKYKVKLDKIKINSSIWRRRRISSRWNCRHWLSSLIRR
jgi:hypothetical protein